MGSFFSSVNRTMQGRCTERFTVNTIKNGAPYFVLLFITRGVIAAFREVFELGTLVKSSVPLMELRNLG